MKAFGIMKALAHATGRGMAEDTLNDLPEGGQPDDLPVPPETEAMGPPEIIPPVETGGQPEFDEATGLPMIVIDKLPEGFRSGEDEEDEDDDLELLL